MRPPSLLLQGLRYASEGRVGQGDLRLRRGRIQEIGASLNPRRGERVVELAGHLALPGLINAHDHLGRDLMPALGSPPYRSFYRWAEDIYRPDESPLREILAVAERDRLLWGGWRNLASGVTTVLHHDPYRRRVFRSRFPLRVPRVAFSHSLGFAPSLARDHARARGKPWVVHAAEGTDERARQEVNQLEELGLLAPRTVLVHGVGLTPKQEDLLERRRVSLVWCPASNLHLYGATARIDSLRERIPIALGTDSTLSGSPSLLDELRTGLATGLATAGQLLTMVMESAADLFGLEAGEGRLRVGGVADLILIEDPGSSPADILLAATPESLALVMVGGVPTMASPDLARRLGLGPAQGRLAGRARWFATDLGRLRDRIVAKAGDEVLASHPLWSTLGI